MINIQEPHGVFADLYRNYRYKFLFESKDVSKIYGRLSLIGIDPALKISGKNNKFSITKLNKRGSFYLKKFSKKDFSICDQYKITDENISGTIENHTDLLEETERSKRINIAQIIRIVLRKFEMKDKTLLGLYGAFSYDFIRLFEDIPNKNSDNDTNDFTLFLYDTFVFFDHLKQKNEIIAYRENQKEARDDIEKIAKQINGEKTKKTSYKIQNPKFALRQKEYEDLVRLAGKYTEEGELFEIVFSNILRAKFQGDPFALYLKYRESNPSPYLFYFDFHNEQLVGASPEMMVRCENNIVNLRPISGTAKRGKDPIEDHENMLALRKIFTCYAHGCPFIREIKEKLHRAGCLNRLFECGNTHRRSEGCRHETHRKTRKRKTPLLRRHYRLSDILRRYGYRNYHSNGTYQKRRTRIPSRCHPSIRFDSPKGISGNFK
ncbi:MAG: Glutamine amidotransferase of anthranilate synthase [Candidatus Peregrinibacteria bacterium GW2011_GWA2_43_8]|nr:MAG: Glutamine amidotransferase of anthranilate synthase [Candidatus Peregrinibacteria bacterium GW2011_GWA2_43_8]